MPFAKGQSGNPRGRPKKDFEVMEAARLHGEAAINKLVELLNCGDQRVEKAAADALLDRGYGKPMASMELSGKDGAPLAYAFSVKRAGSESTAK